MAENDWFGEWLAAQRELQQRAFGVVPEEQDASFLRYNLLGVLAELGEVMQEADWRPWSKSEGRITSRDKLTEELVDVLHFIGNVVLWAGISSGELTASYKAKVKENTRRQLHGYANLPETPQDEEELERWAQ